MKASLIFAAILAAASGQTEQYPGRYISPAPITVSLDQAATIITQENEVYPDGHFRYGFSSDNGINVAAQGTPKVFNGNPPQVPVVHQGTYSYISPEGQPVGISYTADENGYQPQGDSIPTPPPIPLAILKALDYIASRPPAPQQYKL